MKYFVDHHFFLPKEQAFLSQFSASLYFHHFRFFYQVKVRNLLFLFLFCQHYNDFQDWQIIFAPVSACACNGPVRDWGLGQNYLGNEYWGWYWSVCVRVGFCQLGFGVSPRPNIIMFGVCNNCFTKTSNKSNMFGFLRLKNAIFSQTALIQWRISFMTH